MGICYYVACLDCKVCRDLDKLSPSMPRTRGEALESQLRVDRFRAALLVGFMAEHQGHKCTMFNDVQDQCDNEDFAGDDSDFWE